MLLIGLRGREALSESFRFELDLLSPGPTAVPVDRLVGQRASVRLSVPGCPERFFTGILSEIGPVNRVRSAKQGEVFVRYRAELVPELWLLRRRIQSRIF